MLLVSAVVPAWADIISTSPGVTVLPSPPPSLQINQLQSNTDIFAIRERMNETLFVPIPVDASDPGSYDTFADLSPSILSAGMTVNSYILHADPDIPLQPFIAIPYNNRSVTFDPTERIVGIMVDMFTLWAGNPFLEASGTAYPPLPVFSGLELDLADGPIVISPDRRNITVNFSVGTGLDFGGVDQVRVITSTVVPEPFTASLVLAGLAAILGRSRVTRRFRRSADRTESDA
jgi:hypothetical protein